MADAKVGDTVWIFDSNRRVYKDGRGGAIYAEHWYSTKIVGENRASWIVLPHGRGMKIDKKTCALRGELYGTRAQVEFSRDAVDADIWLMENRWRIAELLQRCNDVTVLKAVAKAIGLKEQA